MSKNKHWAIWYLFTTMLSIFSICTIRIFDGFNWPFYAVTVNALISLGGLVFHIHMEEHARKSPGLLAARISPSAEFRFRFCDDRLQSLHFKQPIP